MKAPRWMLIRPRGKRAPHCVWWFDTQAEAEKARKQYPWAKDYLVVTESDLHKYGVNG